MDQIWWQAIDQTLMLLGLLIGVIFSEAVLEKAKTGSSTFSFPRPTVKDIVIYFIIAIIITPIVYEKTLNLDPALPLLIRFGLYVQAGVSYPIIFSTFSYKVNNI